MTQAQALLVLARPPQAGRLRTRLGDPMGPESAVRLEMMMAAQVWSVALQVQARQIAHAWTVIDPPELASSHQQWLQGGTGVLPYEGHDPDTRLANVFRLLFREGYSRIILIGTGCLGLNPAVIAGSFQALSSSEVVIGPTTDGGLWLLGMRQFHRRLIESLRWDQGHLFDDVLFRGSQATLSTLILPTQTSLESPEDARAILGAPYADRLPAGLIELLKDAGGIAV